MLELFAAATGIELGKFVLEQVLNLGKDALEDYVKDFFKDCLQTGVVRVNSEKLKKPMAEAIGFFIRRFLKELQMNDVPDTSINHYYKGEIKRFVRHKAVRPILGKAFEKDCKQIDYKQLQRIWMENPQNAQWQFPAEEFDWRGVAKEYAYEVRGIIKADAELRSLLETELLEDIARNTAQISPGFDVAKYRESLQCSYGYLKLYVLDSTDRVDAIKLWSIFIEQTVREALPPTRYDLPLDLKQQLQERGELEADLSPEALERYRYEYFQQPSRKVLEAVAESPHAVILGDPGAGKSTLLQYLALEWVEGNTQTLPLLIELREFVLSEATNFLDFLHCGRGADWQFDRALLHEHLLENPTLVMFDGLDEVFDRATQATIIDDIIRFSKQYDKARVLVTSRIIGYNPERLQQADFRHFTIQPLDTEEIHEFIDRWYDLSMGGDRDKTQLQQRLKDAIANSQAIQNLADNPLLLTMMAILNRRQELPRDRADLYDQASRVLLYHWDVDHKRLQLPMDAIARREKQEMLRLIAYEMQTGEEGLKGNLISADRLTQILTDYLRHQGFSEPREKANRVIGQLRERNFILCYRGADTYGFMHRTFLEYFCAVEIVNRFEKQRTLSFEELRDEVFGEHWQDETWHEVLCLICGMVDPKFAGKLIEFLINIEIDRSAFIDEHFKHKFNEVRIQEEGIINLLLAVECWAQVVGKNDLTDIKTQLLQILKQEVIAKSGLSLGYYTSQKVCNAIAKYYSGDSQTLIWLHDFGLQSSDWVIRRATILAIAKYYDLDSQIILWLKERIKFDDASRVRRDAMWSLLENYDQKLSTLDFILDCFKSDTNPLFLESVIKAVYKYFSSNSESLILFKNRAIQDRDYVVRDTLIRGLSKYFNQEPGMFDFFCEVVKNDPCGPSKLWRENCRKTALEALLTHYPTYPKTLELLNDRAANDPDEQLREWAQEQLKKFDRPSKTEDN